MKPVIIALIVLAVLYVLFIVFFFILDFTTVFALPMDKFLSADGLRKMYERRDRVLALPYSEEYITSRDGLKLYGRWFFQENSERLVVMCHGWKSDWYADFAGIAYWFYTRKCSLLIIDERAAGKSEGKLVTFSMKERKDIADWVRWAHAKTDLPIYLYGTSMGAASVLMASEEVGDLLHGITADSPFMQPYEELKEFASRMLHLPEKPFLPSLNLLVRMIMKVDFREGSAYEAVRKTTVPITVFHGKEDWFCNWNQSIRLKEMNLNHVNVYLFDDCGHCASWFAHQEEYIAAMEKFWKESC